MISFLASLPDKGKVKQHLAHTVCDADEQALEKYLSLQRNTPSSLLTHTSGFVFFIYPTLFDFTATLHSGIQAL